MSVVLHSFDQWKPASVSKLNVEYSINTINTNKNTKKPRFRFHGVTRSVVIQCRPDNTLVCMSCHTTLLPYCQRQQQIVVFGDSTSDAGRRFAAPASFDFDDIGPFPWKNLFKNRKSNVSE